MFQLPFPIDEAWTFNGVHGPRKEAIDFSIGRPWPRWKSDTSQIWVVAAADGIIRKTSACGLEIDHDGGWTTVYYHLEHIVRDSGPVKANERLANIANTPREAACDGGSASAPHLHFALKYNGAFVPIDGLTLSGWRIHSGRGRYDSSCDRMYLGRGGERICPYTSPLANRGIPKAGDPALAASDVAPAEDVDSSQGGGQQAESIEIELDSLPDGAPVYGGVALYGWAVDRAGTSDTGVDHVHMYLDGPAGQGAFVAEATYDLDRPDVASALGDQRYARAGFGYKWESGAVAPGQHTLYIYAHSTVAGWSYITRTIVVQP